MKKSINRKRHGSVLLTVVFVMSILIVFLFGTLALAIAANNRSHVNYSSAQTSITARAVAESAIRAIENSTTQGKAYAKAVGQLKKDQSFPVKVQLNGTDIGTMGDVEDVIVSHVGTKEYYDVITESWEIRDVLKFTATVNMSGVKSSSSIYVIKHFEEDKTTNSRGGAGFVTTAGAALPCQTNLFGGSYVMLPPISVAEKYEYENTHNDRGFNKITLDQNGNPNKGGAETFVLNNSGAVIEADLYVNGNMYVENWSGIVYPKTGTGVAVMGDMAFHNNVPAMFKYQFTGNLPASIPFNEVPFLYVDGTILGRVKLGEANSDFPMNVFCGNIDLEKTQNPSEINANLYCMDEGANNYIKNVPTTNLYDWTGSVIKRVTANKTKNTEVNGEICSNGNLTLDGVTVNGDVRVRGNVNILNGTEIKGDLICGGTITGLTPDNVDGTVYNDNMGSGKAVIPNKKGYYYVHTPMPDPENEGVWLGPDDQPLNDGFIFIDGKYVLPEQEDIPSNLMDDYGLFPSSPSEFLIYYVMNDGKKQSVDGASEIYYGVDYQCSFDENIWFAKNDDGSEVTDPSYFDGTQDYGFYIETYVVDGTFVDNGDGTFTCDLGTNYIKVEDETFNFSYGAGAQANTQKYLTQVNERSIYPKYAERKVIFGLDDDYGRIMGKEGKILMTMEEILTDVANPYEEEKLPGLVANNASTKTYNSNADLAADNYTITENCTINASGVNQPITIKPGKLNLLIRIENFEIQAGKDILIDDSEGGSVYFYIEENGHFHLNKNNIVTKTFRDLIDGGNTKFAYDSSTIPATNTDYVQLIQPEGSALDTSPNVYLYGGKGSKFEVDNMNLLTMNIVSASIGGHIKGGEPSGITSMVYNNYDVAYNNNQKIEQFIIGCVNVENIDIQNRIGCIYVPSDGNKQNIIDDPEDIFWYKTLYYSEF